MSGETKTFTVVGVLETEQRTGDRPARVEKLQLKDPTGEVVTAEEWRPGTIPGRAVDAEVTGSVFVDPKWGPKFREAKQNGRGFGGGGRRPSDPAERASIEAQTALKAAVELTVGLARADKLPPQFTQDGEALSQAVVRIAGQFFDGIHMKAKGA